MHYSLYNYLYDKENISHEILDALCFDINIRVYYYGAHFKSPYEGLTNQHIFKRYLKSIFYNFNSTTKSDTSNSIVTNAYHGLPVSIEAMNYKVSQVPWSNRANGIPGKLSASIQKVTKIISTANYKELINEQSINSLSALFTQMLEYYSDKKGLIVPYDMPLFENLSIQAFKQLKKPSLVFLHGLPGRYNSIDDNRADYLAVWGDDIKKQYVAAGVSSDKIFVAGNPIYGKYPENIESSKPGTPLVITKSLPGGQVNTGKVILADRGNSILYLMLIKDALKKTGITKARLRPHPSENKAWYRSFIGDDFYEVDTLSLSESLKKTSFVVGPTSTVFLDASFAGINYIIFEPNISGIDIINYKLVEPFTESTEGVVFTASPEELVEAIKEKKKTDVGVLHQYVKLPFDLSFLRDIFK